MQSAHIGGAERHLLDLLPGLRAAGWDIHFFGIATGPSEFATALAAAGVPTTVRSYGRLADPRVIRDVRALARELRPAIVHTHLFYGDVLGQLATLARHERSVRTIHTTATLMPTRKERWASSLAGVIADRTIAISGHVADFTRQLRLAPTSRVRVVRYGVDLAHWVSTDQQRERARAELGFGPSDVVVACTGRLYEGKGQDVLLHAVSTALSSVPNLKVVIAGDGVQAPRLEELAAATLPSAAYRFTGFQADVRGVLAAADILSFPTTARLGEALGLSVIEAMAFGIPVVASDLPAVREVIDHPTTGILVPPDAVDELGRAIADLAKDREARSTMAVAARASVAERYRIDRMVKETAAVYDEVLGSS